MEIKFIPARTYHHCSFFVASENFIGTNIEEIAVYDGDKIRQNIAKLIRAYNGRINNIESDKSLMIEEPKWISYIMTL
ncbi:TPA: DUF4928 family protein [Morganella morganii]|nr:DUF4928 family protein [Morganella morganii]